MSSDRSSGEYYRLLNVPSTASAEAIRKAYKSACRRTHPDRHNNSAEANEQFKRLQEAYAVLSDGQKRALYDCYGIAAVSSSFRDSSSTAAGPSSAFDSDDAFRMFAKLFGATAGQAHGSGSTGLGAHPPFRETRDGGASTMASEDDTSSDFFANYAENVARQHSTEPSTSSSSVDWNTTMMGASLLGKRSKVTLQPPAPPGQLTLVPTRSYPLHVTLEELYTGCIKRLYYTRNFINPTTAQISSSTQQFLDVAIQPGWRNGTKLTYRGIGDQLGNRNPQDITSGDIVVVIQEQPHQRYSRSGNDLITIQRVPLLTALTGGSVQVNKLDAEALDVELSDIIAPGSEVVLGGQGMPDPENPMGTHGNLIVRFEVEFPKKLDSAAQTKLKEIPELVEGAEHRPHDQGQQ